MGAFDNDSSMEGDVYVQRLASYIRRNEEALANGLLCFSRVRALSTVKPLRPSFTTHHLYYISERIASSALDVDVGPLNVKLDSPNHEPTYISFMANNARSQRHFDSDARSITSINSMKSIVSSASVYWMSFSFSKDPKVIQKDVKYLYLSFTKIPCLILSPHTKINSVSGYEEYPCDTSVPLKMFKNLQVLELVEYEPNEVFGWHTLSEKLRILIVRLTKVSDLAEILLSLVVDDENGRSSFNMRRQSKRVDAFGSALGHDLPPGPFNPRKRAMTASGSSSANIQRDLADVRLPDQALPSSKWFYLKQLTVTESSISHVSAFTLKPLANLVKLNLSGNLLDALPEGLEHLHNIKYLNFADNYIQSLRTLPKNLRHLVTINLNNNKIVDLEGMQSLDLLEKIDLRRNKLSTLEELRPLVELVSKKNSRLNNVFVSNNKLHRTHRTDLFNLFNAAKPKNSIRIDDSRPGYIERAILLDPESAKKFYVKFMMPEKFETPEPEKEESKADNSEPPKSPVTPHKKSDANHTRSASDVLESLSQLKIFDLENTMATRKHVSVMTTASTTSAATPMSAQTLSESMPPSPSIRSLSKSIKPLLPNQNLTNQTQFTPQKMPPISRQISSPMMHQNGSSSTLKSSSTIARLDLDSVSLNNLAPSVITPVQVLVEGFQ